MSAIHLLVQPQAGQSPSLNPSFRIFKKAALDSISEVTSRER